MVLWNNNTYLWNFESASVTRKDYSGAVKAHADAVNSF
jgi:hypothetical protein